MTPLIALLVLGQPLGAAELTVGEPQRPVTEKVAFVDMERIFEEFPGTKQAQAELNALVFDKRQKLKIKAQEIAMLKLDIASTTPRSEVVSPSSGTTTVLTSTASRTSSPPASSTGTVTSTGTTPSGGSLPSSAFSAVAPWLQPSTSTAPGALTISSAPPTSSTTTVPGSVSPSTGIVRQTPMRKQDELAAKRQELAKLETAFQDLRRQIEQEIHRMEEEKSLAVMARIYRALEEVANEESVTLIVDRQHVLYSKSALDLTEAVKQRLRGK
ncbi:MAG: OmpH family outer membrane protein [Elusimicrobia bacterium]|nr:OmpH family outer membrane protein [Elusimicrobiota bacterium]